MNITPILAYIVVSSLCLSVFYLFYRLFLHRDTIFSAARLYLAGAIIISFILPLTNLQVKLELPSVGTAEYFNYQPATHEAIQENITAEPTAMGTTPESIPTSLAEPTESSSGFSTSMTTIALIVYLLGFTFVFFRLIRQIIAISICYSRSAKDRINSFFIIRNSTFDHPFSFFSWIFIPDNLEPGDEMNDIVEHEMVHARQLHSADVLIAEILTALMWFNPLVWMMKNSLQLIHEYLADEGALNKGLDKVFYQALLVNQAAESKLIPLTSRFSQSIIKKRITMMSKTKSNRLAKLKLLIILPAIALLLLGIACVKNEGKQVPSVVDGKETNDDIIAAIVPVKMNVLYIGVDNPVEVAVSGFNSEDLTVTLDNGKIRGGAGQYIVNPARVGEATIKVFSGERETGSVTFRVKSMPDPLPRIGVKRNGEINLQELLDAGGLNVWMRSEFDIEFRIISFKMSFNQSGFVREEMSDSDRFTESMISSIKSFSKNQKFYLEEIKAVGPDGAVRLLDILSFTISE